MSSAGASLSLGLYCECLEGLCPGEFCTRGIVTGGLGSVTRCRLVVILDQQHVDCLACQLRILTTKHGRHAFSVAGPTEWDNLPTDIRQCAGSLI